MNALPQSSKMHENTLESVLVDARLALDREDIGGVEDVDETDLEEDEGCIAVPLSRGPGSSIRSWNMASGYIESREP